MKWLLVPLLSGLGIFNLKLHVLPQRIMHGARQGRPEDRVLPLARIRVRRPEYPMDALEPVELL